MAAKRGRTTKLDQTAHDAITQAVAAGMPRHYAAQAAGVHRATLSSWLKRGRRQRAGQYRDLCDAIKKAEAEAIRRNLERIDKAAEAGTWQAAAWWLDRRYPEDFGTYRHEIVQMKKQLAELVKRVEEQYGMVT
jgi:hypothetical protein